MLSKKKSTPNIYRGIVGKYIKKDGLQSSQSMLSHQIIICYLGTQWVVSGAQQRGK